MVDNTNIIKLRQEKRQTFDGEIRTRGDGVDNTSFNVLPSKVAINIFHPISVNTKTNRILKSLKPVEPKSKLIYLVPKYVPKERKLSKYLGRKPKEPKFIPYEPYKAAVESIYGNKIPKKQAELKPSKNDIEIQELVDQMSEIRKFEMKEIDDNNEYNEESLKFILQWEKEKECFETDIKNLRESNSHLENQLKFQVQVNSELKTLLVAAVGEDLESRVQHLTEDKLALARALLNSANHLTSHQEQTEWLSGQCEVWRSKFLASSLMVEELARWKSALTNRTNDLQEVTKTLIEERHKVHSHALKTFNSLRAVTEKLKSETQTVLKYGNILEVSNVNRQLAEDIRIHLKVQEGEIDDVNWECMQPTIAEKTAIKLLQNPVRISNKQDAVCHAVMDAATSLGAKQMFLQQPSIHSCCSHCKGEIQNI